MKLKTAISGTLLLGMTQCWAAGEQIIRLDNVQLSMDDLAVEASRQSGVLVQVELKDQSGLKLLYDCNTTLKDVVQGIKGYYKVKLGVELKDHWSPRRVDLKLVAPTVEVTDAQPMDEDVSPAPTMSAKKSPKGKGAWQRFWNKLTTGENDIRRPEEEAMGSTKIKKFSLEDESSEPSGFEADVGEVPSRLKVETVVRKPSDDDVITLSSEAPLDLPAETSTEEPELQDLESQEALPNAEMSSMPAPQEIEALEDLDANLGTEQPTASILEAEKPTTSLVDTEKPEASILETEQPAASILETEQPAASILETEQPTASILETEQPTASFSDLDDLEDPALESEPTKGNEMKKTPRGPSLPYDMSAGLPDL